MAWTRRDTEAFQGLSGVGDTLVNDVVAPWKVRGLQDDSPHQEYSDTQAGGLQSIADTKGYELVPENGGYRVKYTGEDGNSVMGGTVDPGQTRYLGKAYSGGLTPEQRVFELAKAKSAMYEGLGTQEMRQMGRQTLQDAHQNRTADQTYQHNDWKFGQEKETQARQEQFMDLAKKAMEDPFAFHEQAYKTNIGAYDDGYDVDVRVNPDGSRTYIQKGRDANGTPTGKQETLTLEQAQQLAARKLQALAPQYLGYSALNDTIKHGQEDKKVGLEGRKVGVLEQQANTQERYREDQAPVLDAQASYYRAHAGYFDRGGAASGKGGQKLDPGVAAAWKYNDALLTQTSNALNKASNPTSGEVNQNEVARLSRQMDDLRLKDLEFAKKTGAVPANASPIAHLGLPDPMEDIPALAQRWAYGVRPGGGKYSADDIDKTIATTKRIYGHVDPARTKQTVDKLNAIKQALFSQQAQGGLPRNAPPTDVYDLNPY